VYVIPGNHDNREEMRTAFLDKSYIPRDGFIQYVIDDYPVRLIGLDTHVPNEPYGILCKQRILWLEESLKTNPSKPTLLFMHHFPIKVGQKCFDSILCRLENDLEKLIKSHPNVMGIVAGHYHKACTSLFGGRICFVAPSTAPTHYFATSEDTYITAIDLVHPSFTIHRWMGRFQMVSECIQAIEHDKRLPIKLREK
jgi:3',5'-cyclic AMP phosphodiesterase CpdA